MTRLLKLAWRNVWRNRRRSLITMSTILFSIVIIAFTRSMQYGTYRAMEEQAIRLYTGEIQVHRAGFQDEQTLSYSLQADEKAWPEVLAQPWVEAFTRRLTGFGLISSDSSSVGGMIVGIEPSTETVVSVFAGNVVEGHALEDGDANKVLLGQTLARNLAVGVGDTVVVLTQGFRNEMGADLYVVKGVVKTGSADVDRAMMIMPLADAQSLFSMQGRFTEIVVRTRDVAGAGQYAGTLRAALEGTDVEVMDWETLLPELRQMIILDNVSGAIFLAFMLLLVGFEIFNTTMMSVMERVREFGIMQSIGMQPGQIGTLVFLELMIKISIALAAGMAVATGLVLYFVENPIPLTGEMQEMYEEMGLVVEGMMFSDAPGVFLEPLLAVALISLLVVIYPVLRVRQFRAVEALRTN